MRVLAKGNWPPREPFWTNWESKGIERHTRFAGMNIKAICFDLGGVLVEIHHFWKEILERAGVEAQCVPHPLMRLGDLSSLESYQEGELSFSDYLDDLTDQFGLSSRRDARSVHDAIIVGQFSGATEIVEAVAHAGMATGCLSNTNEAHWETLSEPGRYPAFQRLQTRIGSHSLRVSKPDSRAYRAFEAEVGASGQDIAFFDDSAVHVAAAKTLGWDAVHIHGAGNPIDQIVEALALRNIVLPQPALAHLI
jgi:FMN phosphatase YigB (HAD superfamily)